MEGYTPLLFSVPGSLLSGILAVRLAHESRADCPGRIRCHRRTDREPKRSRATRNTGRSARRRSNDAQARVRINGGLRPSRIRAFAQRASMRVYPPCGLSLARLVLRVFVSVEIPTREGNDRGKSTKYQLIFQIYAAPFEINSSVLHIFQWMTFNSLSLANVTRPYVIEKRNKITLRSLRELNKRWSTPVRNSIR